MNVNMKDMLAKRVNGVHQALFKLTDGRIGGRVAGMPAVMLTTTGRKSGQKRTAMLTSPVHDEDKIVLVASYGGDDRHPSWYLNLRDNPDVEIIGLGRSGAMTARTATTDERSQLWPKVTAAYGGYANYQTKTDREIPLVILEGKT